MRKILLNNIIAVLAIALGVHIGDAVNPPQYFANISDPF
jgi:hypothetical protein